MKLETSEADREWVRKRVDYIRSQGGPFILDDRVYCDFLTLLAEVERLMAERRPFSDGLAQKVIDEQVKTIARLTAKFAERAPPLPAEVEELRQSLLSYAANIAAADDMPHLPKTVQAMRNAASLLSRWPGVWRPIETAPKDGTWVKVYWPTMPISWSYPSAFNHDDGYGWLMPANLDYGEIFPTHWSPLPEPPHE